MEMEWRISIIVVQLRMKNLIIMMKSDYAVIWT